MHPSADHSDGSSPRSAPDLRVFIHTAHSFFRAARQKGPRAGCPPQSFARRTAPPHFPTGKTRRRQVPSAYRRLPGRIVCPASGLQHRNGNPIAKRTSRVCCKGILQICDCSGPKSVKLRIEHFRRFHCHSSTLKPIFMQYCFFIREGAKAITVQAKIIDHFRQTVFFTVYHIFRRPQRCL